MNEPDAQQVQLLLNAANAGELQSLEALAGGKNNRVYRVNTSDIQPMLLKVYFRHPHDPRDRLSTEFRFSQSAWESGVRCIPKPLGADYSHGLALYEFIEGTKLESGMVNASQVRAACNFVQTLNEQRAKHVNLPNASEACFSLQQHFATIAGRIRKLEQIEPVDGLHRHAKELVDGRFIKTAKEQLLYAQWYALKLGFDLREELPQACRCLSPSDFGFHNAIHNRYDDRLYFCDFEYAGWDDPAKLICDFFCQPAIPAPQSTFDEFVQAIAALTSDPPRLIARAELLLPLYRIKWICIMLNDFLPVGNSRRAFAENSIATLERLTRQLVQARSAIEQLQQPAFDAVCL